MDVGYVLPYAEGMPHLFGLKSLKFTRTVECWYFAPDGIESLVKWKLLVRPQQ